MNSRFFCRLAWTNIRNNAQTYLPYVISFIGTIMMYYIMVFIATNQGLEGEGSMASLRSMMGFGTWVTAIFAVIFLFYTNSFLIKRRKKEFGLYNILGLEKRHISYVMFLETLAVMLTALLLGLLLGIILSKLLFLLLLKLLDYEVRFGFTISGAGIVASLKLFSCIFALLLLYNLLQIRLAKPIELLKGGQTGEREPKTKWLLTLIGLACLGGGYYLALRTENPLEVLLLFFVAVVLVIIGTYCLFTAGSIALLKRLRANKRYYYQPKHFIGVSGMIYRMKQNAAGLASICILSTMVLVTISTTVCLYVGMEDALRAGYPRQIQISGTSVDTETALAIDAEVSETLADYAVEAQDFVRYRGRAYFVYQQGNQLQAFMDSDTISQRHVVVLENNDICYLFCLTLEEYNRMQGTTATLAADEVLLYALQGEIAADTLRLEDYELRIAGRLTELNTEDTPGNNNTTNIYYVVVADNAVLDQVAIAMDVDSDTDAVQDTDVMQYYCGFDLPLDDEQQIEIYQALAQQPNINAGLRVSASALQRDAFLSTYGGLFFLGIFLGLLFIMAAVLIIYYKQISEGYDDKARFEIMRKVGMDRREIKRTIHSQVLTVFFLPLLAAMVHVAFAFRMIRNLLALFNMYNVSLYLICIGATVLLFALAYAVIYYLTARTYYKIVS